MNSGARTPLKNRANLWDVANSCLVYTRGCIDTHVHRKMVIMHVVMRLRVPRPEFSSTHPTSVPGDLSRQSEQDKSPMEVFVLDSCSQCL